MICPKCGSKARVVETRNADAPEVQVCPGGATKKRIPAALRPLLGDTGRWRRHCCSACNNQFDSVETLVPTEETP